MWGCLDGPIMTTCMIISKLKSSDVEGFLCVCVCVSAQGLVFTLICLSTQALSRQTASLR